MNVIAHVVQSSDTIQSLAAKYLGSADKWRDIVDFNNLDYPYIVTDGTFQTQVPASGNIIVTRTYTATTITIQAGTNFVVINNQKPILTFVSLRSVTLPAGIATAIVPVQCSIPGYWGNVPEGTNFQISTTDPTLQNAFSSIVNQTAFANGNIYNVKQIGDTVLIPVGYNPANEQTPTYSSIDDFYTQVFGTDIELTDDGDFVFDSYGDIGSVSGIANLAQAIRDRLLTPKGDLPYHPEYGSLLEEMIGTAAPGYVNQLITVTIQTSLLEDDRIASAVVTNVSRNGTAISVTVQITPVEQAEAVTVPISLPNILAA